MLRPLLLDLFDFFWPIGLGCLVYGLGVVARRWPGIGARLGLPLFLAGVGGLGYWQHGWTLVLSWLALFLLGVAATSPRRSFSSAFLVCLVLLAGGMILLETSGRMWWRFCAPEAWQRGANEQGHLRQSSGTTCGPVSAVMLLHYHGLDASEGEMAYRAGSTWFGSSAQTLVRALTEKVQEHGGWAEVRQENYAGCLARDTPFVAIVRRPDIGRHAVFVEKVTETEVQLVDPLYGSRNRFTRLQFEQEWVGTAVVIRWPVKD